MNNETKIIQPICKILILLYGFTAHPVNKKTENWNYQNLKNKKVNVFRSKIKEL